jgi:hypothetical protein
VRGRVGRLAECKRDARAIDQPVRRVQEHIARTARPGAVVHVHTQRRPAARRLELDNQVGPVPGVRVRTRVRVRVRARARVRVRACLCRDLSELACSGACSWWVPRRAPGAAPYLCCSRRGAEVS